MLLDVLAKFRQFRVYAFFLNCFATKFHWAEIVKIVACQYREALTNEEVHAMVWSTKVNYLKRNLVTVAKQIDFIYSQLWDKVVLSGIHPIGEILNFDDRRKIQNRETEHMHAPIHVVDRCYKSWTVR